ncbi:drug/metabolite exporter YedA [Acidovorax sp. SUPP3334]|uniref:drug/metabolite exporter YedA n=1 Tax=Acidovorax sp. SUPP3334 TaxID=2920881 RepID=UPI0023DE489C|nr:drug/metabolite exporter YedA [Acidovorax sp. SUPP3334]GKT23742.1 drug/metabolite exporter YedA [Acidovorax sp. SUPP3334]
MNSSTATTASAAKRLPTLVILALLACYFIWGSTYLAIQVALNSFPPFFQMGGRFLVAGSLLMAWAVWRAPRGRMKTALPTKRQWINAWVVGALMLGGGMGLTATASVHIGSGLIAACVAVVPMMIAAWGLMWGRRPTTGEGAGMALGAIGVLMLMQGSSFSASPASMACILAATMAWSLGSVLSTTRLPLADGASGFASEMLCGGAVLMAVSLALGEQPVWPPQPSAVAAWLYLVSLGSLIGFSAYMYLLRHATPALASSYAFVNPLIALLLGSALAGEHLTAGEWSACAVILTAVLVIFLSRRTR